MNSFIYSRVTPIFTFHINIRDTVFLFARLTYANNCECIHKLNMYVEKLKLNCMLKIKKKLFVCQKFKCAQHRNLSSIDFHRNASIHDLFNLRKTTFFVIFVISCVFLFVKICLLYIESELWISVMLRNAIKKTKTT